MNTQEALRMAISYIEGDKAWLHLKDDVLNACKEALESQEMNMNKTLECPSYLHGMKIESQEQEPVAYETFCELLTDYRKYAFEFGLSDDAETYDLMIDRQKQLLDLFKYAHTPVKDYLTTEKPVGIVYNKQDGYVGQMVVKDIPHKTKLYTHPAQPLSDDEILNLAEYHGIDSLYESGRLDFARAIEKAHGIL